MVCIEIQEERSKKMNPEVVVLQEDGVLEVANPSLSSETMDYCE